MAAAADRPSGDVLERVSPELVLVDAALFEEMRMRLHVEVDDEGDAENDAFAGGDLLPLPATALAVVHHDAGIEDLILVPEDGVGSVPPTLLVVPDEGGTGLVAEPEEIVASRAFEIDDLAAVPAEDLAEPQGARGSYPALPSPPSDAAEEDATEVVLRQIRDHIELEPAPARRRRRLLSFVSLLAALGSIATFTVCLQLGVSELPHWLPS
jgi:hypothetical protein